MTEQINAASARIALVQHGDYRAACRRFAAGEGETYGGQRYSVDVLKRLVDGSRHLIVSLDGKSAALEIDGLGEYATVPDKGVAWVPGRIRARHRGKIILRLLKRFAPTHLLLRANDVIGCVILDWANRRQIPTAIIIASRFDRRNSAAREFCRLANARNVLFVGNHNRVATDSLVLCGLSAKKAIAWDYPPRVTTDHFRAKLAPTSGVLTVLFAGAVNKSKGVLEAVAAVEQAREAGLQMSLTICGDGDLSSVLRVHPGVAQGWLELTGNIASDEVLERMRQSWVVVVPTRHDFPEALPLVITEGLLTRTPVLLSDHPVFMQYFVEDRGVRLFPAGNSEALSSLLSNLASDPSAYRRLSEETEVVLQALRIDCRFDQLVERFAIETGLTSVRGHISEG